LAYTVGPHVVFGADQYSPGTSTGRRLLAHELAHVVQQGQSRPALTGRSPFGAATGRDASWAGPVLGPVLQSATPLSIGPPGEAYEREADAAAEAVMHPPEPGAAERAALPSLARRVTGPVLQRLLVVTPASLPLPPGQLGPPMPFTLAVQ